MLRERISPMGMKLTATLETIRDETSGNQISFGDLVQALNHRGFGALLIGPALVLVLPTGAVPGIPAVCGLIIILICGQILIGRRYPWIPQKLQNFSFDRQAYIKGIDRMKPYTRWIDQFFQRRLIWLAGDTATTIAAFFSIILSLILIFIGFIPFLPMLPGAAILMFGLGLSMKDGVVTALGFTLVGLTMLIVPFILQS